MISYVYPVDPSGPRWEERYSRLPSGLNAGPATSEPPWLTMRQKAVTSVVPPTSARIPSSMFPPSSATKMSPDGAWMVMLSTASSALGTATQSWKTAIELATESSRQTRLSPLVVK